QVENINKLFGYSILNGNRTPTNTEFMAMIADKIRHRNKIANSN
ncbi:MAG: sporulation transcription factor Spo0A, partial [Clostridiaceae bacterium]|nr:sporulation transcription factor Spo0A [Clostridiaceae bacterium]